MRAHAQERHAGPWKVVRVVEHGYVGYNVIQDDAIGMSVATASEYPYYCIENEAFARLLAAAPDLLAALIIMQSYHHERECKLGDNTAECLMMRSAIAKAEGK